MRAKYSLNEFFFEVDCAKSDSWTWKCILHNRHQFGKGIRWKVGDGTKIHFWLDNWCANENFVTLLNITDITQIDPSLMVSHFITEGK